MKLLFKFLTVVLFLGVQPVLANSCEEVELGAIGKNHWRNSFGNGVRSELSSQIDRKDGLFEKLVPELELELIPGIDFNLSFSRKVKNDLPLPSSGKISEYDFFTFKVQNGLKVEFKGGVDTSYLFAGANAGLELIHSSKHLPGKDTPSCELYSKIIDKKTAKGRLFYDSVCVSRDKSIVSRYYQNTINFFSSNIGKALNYFVDTDKNRKSAEDPLAGLKVHSLLGVPLDHSVFFENSNDLAIGDIVEHTSFFGITPLGVKFDLLAFSGPSYSKYRRAFRTLGFKKTIGNKVIVEIEDTVINGTSTEIYKITPRILKIIKLNLGKWGSDSFTQENLVQRFEVDLTKSRGVEFFKNVLSSAYNPSYKLHQDSILINHTGFEDSVIAKSPVYKDGKGRDHKLILKIPGIFDFERRTYENVDTITFEENEYTNGEKLRKKEYKFKLGADLKLFQLRKKERTFQCQMKLSSNSTLVLENNSSMNVECNYKNKYSEERHPKEVREFINMILNGNMKQEDKEDLDGLKYPTRDEINMFTNLSFSKKQINNIIESSSEEMYHEISRLLFGEEAKNVFSEKYHKAWRLARPRLGPNAPLSAKLRTNSDEYKKCAPLFQKLGITKDIDPLYAKFDGLVGQGKGIDGYSYNRCYKYFKQATTIVDLVKDIKDTIKTSGSVSKMLDLFLELEKVGFAQALLVRLAGGIHPDGVRYSYIVASPNLDKVIAQSNGPIYNVENKELRKSLSSELESEFFPRIKDLKFTYNVCEPKVLFATFKLNNIVEDRKSIYGQFQLKKYHLTDNQPLQTDIIRFDRMIRNVKNEYIARIELDEPLNKQFAHNMYFKLLNKDDLRLSREVKVYLKEVETLFDLNL
ncbi:MAG: hypothetical protein ACJAS4_003086 [Bacteriovoracaceae bacterium]|jgi:hypothetical protein